MSQSKMPKEWISVGDMRPGTIYEALSLFGRPDSATGDEWVVTDRGTTVCLGSGAQTEIMSGFRGRIVKYPEPLRPAPRRPRFDWAIDLQVDFRTEPGQPDEIEDRTYGGTISTDDGMINLSVHGDALVGRLTQAETTARNATANAIRGQRHLMIQAAVGRAVFAELLAIIVEKTTPSS